MGVQCIQVWTGRKKTEWVKRKAGVVIVWLGDVFVYSNHTHFNASGREFVHITVQLHKEAYLVVRNYKIHSFSITFRTSSSIKFFSETSVPVGNKLLHVSIQTMLYCVHSYPMLCTIMSAGPLGQRNIGLYSA